VERHKPHSVLGAIIREQRELLALPMRQLAKSVGISNPYLSQIERGLTAPSEAVVAALAASLDLSVEDLYRRAGYVEPATSGDAILDDGEEVTMATTTSDVAAARIRDLNDRGGADVGAGEVAGIDRRHDDERLHAGRA
jgi:transcriptional regulator with XRE-family HTH domain